MSSLAKGFILHGSQWSYRILRPLPASESQATALFKAKVIPKDYTPGTSSGGPQLPKWAIIKIASPSNENSMTLNRELKAYSFPTVATSQCFRKLYDILDFRTTAWECLDTTLAEVEYQLDPSTYSLILDFLKATLESCILLEDLSYANADIQPSNILISNLNTDNITVKVGNLGI
ncbi:hypothetical protein BO78DRAFT_423414, partial [Aspergillus sclerotiicarbonarius CBS 121057]